MRRLLIEFDVDENNLDDIHKVRNCAEDLFSFFEKSGQAQISLEEADRATSRVHVEVVATRLLGIVEKVIQKKLRQHFLSARVSRVK